MWWTDRVTHEATEYIPWDGGEQNKYHLWERSLGQRDERWTKGVCVCLSRSNWIFFFFFHVCLSQFFEEKEAAKQAAIAVFRLLNDFSSIFQNLIRECSSSASNSLELLSSSTTMVSSSDHLSKTLRLIIILNNFAYTRRFVLPRLKKIFLNYGFRGMDRVFDEVESNYKRVDDQLLETVQNEYLRPFVNRLESRMYAGRFDWATHARVTGVKDYVKHIVLDLARIHAEVYSISSQLVFLVLSRLLATLVQDLAKLYRNINQFSKAGSMQACLDLIALQECLGRCMESETSTKLNEIISLIPDAPESIKSKALTDLLNSFLKQMQPYSIAFRDVQQQTPSNGSSWPTRVRAWFEQKNNWCDSSKRDLKSCLMYMNLLFFIITR